MNELKLKMAEIVYTTLSIWYFTRYKTIFGTVYVKYTRETVFEIH